MEYTDLIHTRESVRNYDPDRPVPEAILEKILDAGRRHYATYRLNFSNRKKHSHFYVLTWSSEFIIQVIPENRT